MLPSTPNQGDDNIIIQSIEFDDPNTFSLSVYGGRDNSSTMVFNASLVRTFRNSKAKF